MEEFTVKALCDDIRNSVGCYLTRELTDQIIGGLLEKYHILMTDAELLSLVEVREVEIEVPHRYSVPPVHRHNYDDLHRLLQERLNRLAVENQKASITIRELNNRQHYHNGDKYKAISWALK